MRKKAWIIIIFSMILMLAACASTPKEGETSGDFVTQKGRGTPLRIVAGSEVKVFEPIIEEYSRKTGRNVEMTYKGSLDIMRLLQDGSTDFDAVWPASTIWLNMGDEQHLLKHTQTTSITPVIFGIRKSLAEELGFTNGEEVTMDRLMEAIESGKLKFAMTSATQSNSGAGAYLAFLTALSETPEDGLSGEDLKSQELAEKITSLLSGVNRSSGSSNWLVDLFLMGEYDAMVNYEQLIIQTNKELEKQGKEILYAVYPVDGLSISDSPLAYVDAGDSEKEEAFLEFQEYMLSDEAQSAIEKTGKRNAYGKVREANRDVYRKDWGVDVDKILAPIRLPQSQTIVEALDLYQTQFKKPAYTVYVLDYSGSMAGEGMDQMISALEQVFVPENAQKHLLLGTGRDKTVMVPFSSDQFMQEPITKEGNDLTALYDAARRIELDSSTFLYEAVIKALEIVEQEPNLDNYTPAVVLLTDGKANGYMGFYDLEEVYRNKGLDVPIFSIVFGDADERELEDIAQLSNARVFDGTKDLIHAFRSVKGYN